MLKGMHRHGVQSHKAVSINSSLNRKNSNNREYTISNRFVAVTAQKPILSHAEVYSVSHLGTVWLQGTFPH